MNGAWWNEQLAGYGRAGPLPAVYDPGNPIPGALQRDPAGSMRAGVIAADEWGRWWNYARASARRLAAGIDPPAIDVYGPVLEDDEEAVLDTCLHFSRLYGGDGRYRKADLLVLGRPAVMAGAFALTAAINHRRKVTARRDAEPRWRDQRYVQVIATTDRLLCNTDSGWLSCWYGSVTEIYPDLQHWSLTLGFDPGIAPLRLSGPPAPAICIWAAHCVLGQRWMSDPRLSPLLH